VLKRNRRTNNSKTQHTHTHTEPPSPNNLRAVRIGADNAISDPQRRGVTYIGTRQV